MIDSTSYCDNCLVVSLPMDVRNLMRGLHPHPINSIALDTFFFSNAFLEIISFLHSLALPILTELEQRPLFFNWESAEYTLSTVKPSLPFIISQYSLNRHSYVSRPLKSTFSCNHKNKHQNKHMLSKLKKGGMKILKKKKPLKMNNYTTRGN